MASGRSWWPGAWTRSGAVRHAVFQGLRADKPAGGVGRELAAHVDGERQQANHKGDAVQSKSAIPQPQRKPPATLKVSNPERIIDQASGTCKIGLPISVPLERDGYAKGARGLARPMRRLGVAPQAGRESERAAG